MQFYGREFYSDENVVIMTLEQQGAYMRLLWNCWQEGSIPSEAAKLRAICGNDPRFEGDIWPGLKDLFVPREDGRLIHPKVESLRKDRNEYVGKCSDGGKRSAEKRWGKVAVSDLTQDLRISDKSPVTLQSPISKETPVIPFPTKPQTTDPLAAEFERWIAEYPNPVKVDTAMRSWLTLIGTGEITTDTLADVHAGLQRWRDSAEWARDDGKYIPAPATFLTGNEKQSGRMWKDHPPASAEAKISRRAGKKSSAGVDPNAEWSPDWQETA